MKKQEKDSVKRVDLQAIRGIAIISVLLFHFFPKFFPNGFLGVDQFFVLSGFLMCMLLMRREQASPCSLVSLFYSKRMKRILPLYLFVIFLEMISLYSVFPASAVNINKKSAPQALIFMSNRASTVEENYFRMLSIAIDLFTHTWSLSVEVQFYLLIPFIYLFGRNLSLKSQYFYYLIIGIISYGYSSISPPTVAFNCVLARIWQFMIGFLVYMASTSDQWKSKYATVSQDERDSENEEVQDHIKLIEDDFPPEKRETQHFFCRNPGKSKLFDCFRFLLPIFLIFFNISLVFNPILLNPIVLRPLVTVSTGALMIFSKDEPSILLNNGILTYVGDISYALYLLHWPIYSFWKLTMDQNYLALIFCILASILISIIIHENYEKWYLKQCSTTIGLLTIILFILNVIMIKKDDIFGDYGIQNGRNDTYANTARLNHQWNVEDIPNLYSPTCVYEGVNTPMGWCRHTGLTGKYRFMTLGNSWTANHATMFYQECGYLASSILQGSSIGCEPLYPSQLTEMCISNFTDFEEHVKMESPDYAFMFTRFISIGDPVPANGTDPIYQQMKEQLTKYLPFIKKKIYILNAMPRINNIYVERIAPMLKNGVREEIIDRHLMDLTLYETARERYFELEKDCDGKCILVDYVPEFWNSSTNTFRFYDEQGLSYFTTSLHLSPRGIEHIRHVWNRICKNFE